MSDERRDDDDTVDMYEREERPLWDKLDGYWRATDEDD